MSEGYAVTRGDDSVRSRGDLRWIPGREGRGRDRDDLGRRAVVRCQLNHGRTGVAFGEGRDGARISTVPAVDGLAWVAHREQVLAGTEPGVKQSQLRRVGVLELVDEEVLEPPVLHRGECRVRGDVLDEAIEQILEVNKPKMALFLFVARVPLGDLGQIGERDAARHLRLCDVATRWD